MKTNRDLAKKIANELFRDGGSGREAKRLVLAICEGETFSMSGWGKLPAIDRIEMVIDNWFAKRLTHHPKSTKGLM